MANFLVAYDYQRGKYIEHFGVKGMRWGVINEDEPTGMSRVSRDLGDMGMSNRQYMKQYKKMQDREYALQKADYNQMDRMSELDYNMAQMQADRVRQANEEQVAQHRKEVRSKIIKGVAVGALVTGLAVFGVKRHAKKVTGEKQSLGSSLGILGNDIGSKFKKFGQGFKSGITGQARAEGESKMQEAAAAKAERTAQKVQEKAARRAQNAAARSEKVAKAKSGIKNFFSKAGSTIKDKVNKATSGNSLSVWATQKLGNRYRRR